VASRSNGFQWTALPLGLRSFAFYCLLVSDFEYRRRTKRVRAIEKLDVEVKSSLIGEYATFARFSGCGKGFCGWIIGLVQSIQLTTAGPNSFCCCHVIASLSRCSAGSIDCVKSPVGIGSILCLNMDSREQKFPAVRPMVPAASLEEEGAVELAMLARRDGIWGRQNWNKVKSIFLASTVMTLHEQVVCVRERTAARYFTSRRLELYMKFDGRSGHGILTENLPGT
jgi:hypothetical protein